MQKSKLNVNAVGANCIRPHFEEIAQNKGITLIALIITIIVMLILVGVTINVALNGGVFTKAEEATIGTEKDAIYEQIITNMELTNNGKIAVKETFDKVLSDFGADKITNINPATVDANTTEVTFSVTGKTGTYNYKISTTKIEKDIAQEPPQAGGLVYGKIYKGTLSEGESVDDWSLTFSKNLGIAFMGNLNDFIRFEYYDETEIVNIEDSQLELIEDGTKIVGNMDGMDVDLVVTEEELFNQYQPVLDDSANINIGLYHNKDINKVINLSKTSSYRCTVEKDTRMSNTYGTSLEEALTSGSVTIVDSKNLSYEGNIYTLVEELE